MKTNKKIPKNPEIFNCENCNYLTSSLKDYTKHCSTQKHKRLTNTNDLSQKIPQNNVSFSCICGNVYKHMSSLCKHKKKCCGKINTINEDDEDTYQGINIKDKDALVLHLLKQNGELQNKIIELASNFSITNNNSHNTNTTNIDKNFNLNFFLNETCKNAMNISEFVSSIQMNLDDLEHTGRTGYIEGISNIIVKNLNRLEQHMRPLHCSDFKREVLYIKDNNEWLKESGNKPILTNAIKTIANDNIKQISKWKDNYPDCTKSESKKNDLYLKIVSNSMNGLTKEEGEKNINKIITNVAKQVTIDK
jgi:hypothetical protein